jgi:hypothetical protein
MMAIMEVMEGSISFETSPSDLFILTNFNIHGHTLRINQ